MSRRKTTEQQIEDMLLTPEPRRANLHDFDRDGNRVRIIESEVDRLFEIAGRGFVRNRTRVRNLNFWREVLRRYHQQHGELCQIGSLWAARGRLAFLVSHGRWRPMPKGYKVPRYADYFAP